MSKKYLIASILALVVMIVTAGVIFAAVFESNTSILYSGTTGQTESFQPLGTGYTSVAGGVGFVETQTLSTTMTIDLQECTDNTYSDCATKISTPAFAASSTTGAEESSSTFSATYTMISSKYYRLRLTSAAHRLQCGNTANMTPIVGADANPSGACNAASGRSIVFWLYEGVAGAARKIRGVGVSR